MKESAANDLIKIEKLLEKIEKDIKKHQDKEIYRESDKYVKHVQKTVELYSLTLDEVLGTTGLSSLPRHGAVLRKMFKGMQGQVKSILKFGLYYFKQRNNKLVEEQMQNDDYMLTITGDPNPQIASCNAVDSRGTPSNSPPPFAGRTSRPHFTLMAPGGSPSSGPNPNICSQSMTTFRNWLNSKSPNSTSYNKDFVLPGSPFNGNMVERGDGSLGQVAGDEEDQELNEYLIQHEKMKEEINDVLKGKSFIEHISPSKVSTNLKQILRGLEYTTKKVDQLTVAPEDDDDLDAPNFAQLGKKIKNAFGIAKVKAVNVLGEVIKSRGDASPGRTQEKFTSGFADAIKEPEKKEPEVDPAFEAEREKQLEELRARIVEIEQEKKDREERLAGVNNEKETLVQDKRNLREKVVSYENEIISLRETLQNSRKEWVEMNANVMSMKRKLAECQEELENQKKRVYVADSPSQVVHNNKVRSDERRPVQKAEREEYVEPEYAREEEETEREREVEVEVEEPQSPEIGQNEYIEVERRENENSYKEQDPSLKSSSSAAVGVDNGIREETLQTLESPGLDGRGEQSLDLKLELSASIPLNGKGENKSNELIQVKSEANTLINLNQKNQKTQGPNVPPINGGNLEKAKEQSNATYLYQNGPHSSSRGPQKDSANPKSNIQIRSPKKANTFIKPSPVVKGKKEVEGHRNKQQNQSLERIPDNLKKNVERVQQPSGGVAGMQSVGQAKSREESRSGQIKIEDPFIEDSIDGDITARKNAPVETRIQRVGTANQIQSQTQSNLDLARERQELRSEGQVLRNVGVVSPRSVRTREGNNAQTNTIVGPVFKSRPEFTGGVVIKGFKEGNSPGFIQSARQTQHVQPVYDFGGRGIVQSVLEIQDEYANQVEYSPKGDLRQHFAMFDKGNTTRGQVIGMNKFGVAINASKKPKRNSLEGLDRFRGAVTGRDEVVQKDHYNFSPITGFHQDPSERMVSEPSRLPFTYKKKGYDVYDSPRNMQISAIISNPRSPYYIDSENPIDLRLPKHAPMARTFRVKLTIDECIRQEVTRDSKEPAATKEEAQMRIMYRAMLTKAKQQPKISAWMRKVVQDSNQNFNEDHPVVDYDAFELYVNNLIQSHAVCGENCIHLRDFYAKIGYLTSWNNREIMSVKRTQIGSPTLDFSVGSPKFPNIKKKKKEIEKDAL